MPMRTSPGAVAMPCIGNRHTHDVRVRARRSLILAHDFKPGGACVLDAVLQTLQSEFSDLPDAAQVTRILLRLSMAALLGGVLGYERERHGKAAGVRTHMLVAMGAALFVLVPQQGGM